MSLKEKIKRVLVGALMTASVLVVLADSAEATPTFVQTSGTHATSSATTITRTFSSNNTAGNLIVVSATWGSNTTFSCSDSNGNTYANIISTYHASVQSLGTCYAANINSGANTVTVTFGASVGYRGINISEYSGVSPLSPVDGSAGNAGTGTTAADNLTSTAVTTTQDGDLIYGAFETWSSDTIAGTGFTQRFDDNGWLSSEDQVQSSAGSIAATATATCCSSGYLGHVVAFKAYASSSSSTAVSTVVDPSFTFTVAGRSSVCNSQPATNFQTGATSTAVSLGHLSSSNIGGGAQDLSVSTNAANGFNVYLKTSGTTPHSLRDGLGHSIADVSGTNASPGAVPTAGTAGFGYTSSDTSTPFTSNTWAKLTSTNESVLIGSSGTSSKSACIGYEVAVASTTPAGTYASTVVYTAIPAF